MALHHFQSGKRFILESGYTLSKFHLGYTTLGELNKTGDNVIWIFHALTANSNPEEWWPMLIGKGKLFDPKHDFIICVNMPGSCYGSLGPLDINPETRQPYFQSFPFFTPRDMIRGYQSLRRKLGIRKIKAGIGGSMGGQQLLEWAIEEPDLFENIYPLATNAVHSSWGRAFNASQRSSIELDPSWKTETKDSGIEGMKIARGIALLSYRHYDTYAKSQRDTELSKLSKFKSESYQIYQGEKLAKRFNAYSYYFLSLSMDAHNVGRGRGTITSALQSIRANTVVIGIENDILFPLSEQEFIAENVPGAEFKVLQSYFGHDGFLLENNQIEKIVSETLVPVKT